MIMKNGKKGKTKFKIKNPVVGKKGLKLVDLAVNGFG